MATKLSLYNEALRILGERNLASLTENREPRRLLDAVYDAGAVNYCLEQGQWAFAMRAVKLEYSPSIVMGFSGGYSRGFEKPTDYVRLAAFCTDARFTSPTIYYATEAGFWFADVDEVYVKYVSNNTSFGKDLSLWPETFTRYAASYLAVEIVERLTQNSAKWDQTYKLAKQRLREALSKDAMEGPTRELPTGSWANARAGGSRNPWRDRGNRGQLIG